MREYIKTMKALSDPNRVRILQLLYYKALCVCEIQELLQLAQSTVSKHMQTLENAELVTFRKDGSWIIYSLIEASHNVHALPMLSHISDHLKHDDEMKEMTKKLPFIIKRPKKNSTTI